jgi:hypothetical protein
MPDLQAPVAESAGLSRRRLLFQRLKEKKEASLGAADVAIPRRGQTVAELSYAQQRIWVLEQMDPGNPRFCVLTALRLRGAAHLGALTAALREIVRRHEILRTRFSGDEGGPRQVVAERPAGDRLPRARPVRIAGEPPGGAARGSPHRRGAAPF